MVHIEIYRAGKMFLKPEVAIVKNLRGKNGGANKRVGRLF